MGAGHAHALYVHGHSPVHRLAPEIKLAAGLAFVVAVAVTPRQAVWAFALDAAVLATVGAVAGLRARFVLARLVIVVPFVAFALLIPFVGSGERVEWLGVSVSRPGLWAAWNVIAKATLGATVSILLAATTEVPRLLKGLDRLGVPAQLTAIAAFMIRYLELIAEEVARVRTAMAARGYQPRWLWQVRPLASAAGALFIRSYERGERTYAAMLSRGYTGSMPPGLAEPAPSRPAWVLGLVPATVAVAAAVAAHLQAL